MLVAKSAAKCLFSSLSGNVLYGLPLWESCSYNAHDLVKELGLCVPDDSDLKTAWLNQDGIPGLTARKGNKRAEPKLFNFSLISQKINSTF